MGARAGVGWAGSKISTVPGPPLSLVLRIPACRRWLPPGPRDGWEGGATALVVGVAAGRAADRVPPPSEQPNNSRAAASARARRWVSRFEVLCIRSVRLGGLRVLHLRRSRRLNGCAGGWAFRASWSRVRLVGAMVEMGNHAPRGAEQVFVGRDREVADLVAGLEDAIAGRVRLLVITGEPGIGKTWLAEHLAEHATKRGARVLWVRCWEAGGAPPFWPWTQLLRILAEGVDDQTLATWLGAGAAQVAQLVPELGERLGTTGRPPAPARASEVARLWLFEAVTGFLRQAAAAQPLLLVLEDLQAADASSLLLLEFLARDLRGGRLLLLGTYRNLAADRVHGIGDAMGQLVHDGHLLTLRGLNRREVRDLVEALSGAEPSEAMVTAVHEATEGNPLFVRETVRLLATDVTLVDPGRLRVPLSGSVRTVIGRRLAPLTADAVLVLSAAAVVGQAFDLALLGPACELPIDRILGGLSEAVELEVVVEEEGAAGRYRFSHSLIREVLYERLPIPVRTDLHRRVGEAIERQYGAGLRPPGRRAGHGPARLRGGGRPVPAGAAGPALPPRRGGPLRAAAAPGRRPGPGGPVRRGGGALPGGGGAGPAAGVDRAAGTCRPGAGGAGDQGRNRQPAAGRAVARGPGRVAGVGQSAAGSAAGPPVAGADLLGRVGAGRADQPGGGRAEPASGRCRLAGQRAAGAMDGRVGTGRAGGALGPGRGDAAPGPGDR